MLCAIGFSTRAALPLFCIKQARTPIGLEFGDMERVPISRRQQMYKRAKTVQDANERANAIMELSLANSLTGKTTPTNVSFLMFAFLCVCLYT